MYGYGCYNARYDVNELGVKMFTELKKILPNFRLFDIQNPRITVGRCYTGRQYSFTIDINGIPLRFGVVRQIVEREKHIVAYSTKDKSGLFIWCEKENSFRIHIPEKRKCNISVFVGRRLSRKNVFPVNNEDDFKVVLRILNHRGLLLDSFIPNSSLNLNFEDLGISIIEPSKRILREISHIGDNLKPIKGIKVLLVHE